MKKRIVRTIVAALVLLLAACGSGNPSSPAAAKEEAPTVELKLSHSQNETAPVTRGLMELSKKLAEKSGGRFKAQVFPSGMLGDTQEMVAQALSGSNIGFMTDAGRFSNFLPEIGILNAPYLFETYEEGNAIVQSDLFKAMTDKLLQQGYRVLSFNWFEGGRHFVTTKEVKSMKDIKNLKIRTGATPEWVATLKAFGCLPTALPQSEVYSGIQSKVVDGADQQIITVYGMKLYEIAPYYILTNHYQLMLGLCVSDKWFSGLPQDMGQLLIAESFAAGEYASQLTLNDVDKMMQEMVQKGLKVYTPDLAEWRAAAQKV
ncbi:MAG: C4-dicarboxylate TRAP transporter substrate-binding protein, partial [Spirochaetia bacterium]|nr:C4-dicarboxylate TRAP transporter substrate-binding protein [Spirochaetia bacterium]